MAIRKEADKLHDFLMSPKSRPDLQTPEGKAWLRLLDHLHGQIGDKFDPLTPWLTREWKKGRIINPDVYGAPGRMFYRRSIRDVIPGQFGTDTPTADEPLRAGTLDHWSDFLQSNHPVRRQLGDIMAHQVEPFHEQVRNWDEAMKAEAQEKALQDGKIVHTTPDGYTIRQLTTEPELEAEGDAMGHCVGGYGPQVQSGNSLIYSLRDPKGYPHVTTEITPQRRYSEPDPWDLERAFEMHPDLRHAPDWLKDQIRQYDQTPYMDGKEMGQQVPAGPGWEDPHGHSVSQLWTQANGRFGNETKRLLPPAPHGGAIQQIQGRGNDAPTPEYQAQMKHWFESFPEEERPQWDVSPISDIDELTGDADGGGYSTYHAGDYGLKHPPVNYERLIPTIVNPETRGRYDYDPAHVKQVYDAARQRGEIPQLGNALTHYSDHTVNDSLNDLHDMNHEYLDYPGEYEDDPERWAEHAAEYGYGDGQEAWQAAWDRYEERERDLADQHGPSQVAGEFYNYMNPHWNHITNQYQNEPYVNQGDVEFEQQRLLRQQQEEQQVSQQPASGQQVQTFT